MPTIFILQTFLPSKRRDCSPSASTLPKPHYPSKTANTLASLVKGRWIDGKTQTVALLLSACDIPTLFILQTFLPSRRRDCSATPRPAPALPKPHYPSKTANTLASLIKGEVLSPEKIRATTGGIVPPSLACYITTLQNQFHS